VSAAATQLKIGLFVLCGVAAVAIVAVVLRVEGRVPVARFHTYFDESISGLDVGSPVEFRGIRIGSVGSITVGPDLAHVDVGLDINDRDGARLELARSASSFRARLQSSGITGVKYVDLEPGNTPAPKLSFAPDQHYIPARSSFLHDLELRAERVGESVPELFDRLVAVADHLERLLSEVESSRLPSRMRSVFDDVDAMVLDARRFVHQIDRAALPQRLADVLAKIDGAAAKLRGFASRLEGDGEVEQAMRELGSAARAFRELVQEVEREPDMLIKGRTASRP
jgi:ABC-type transporter Mla subunit MlaD